MTEFGLESFDAQYDFLLRDRMLLFKQEFNDHQSDPSLLDLLTLKKDLQKGITGDIELFIINKKGVVEYTTYQRDLGLNFSQFSDFFSSLTEIRLGNRYKSDPWIQDYYNSSLYWKYGYLPTDDHSYILEIGLRNEEYSQLHKDIVSQFKNLMKEALQIPDLLYVEIYDKAHRKRTIMPDYKVNLSEITGILNSQKLDTILNQTFTSKRSSLIHNNENKQQISIQYVDLSSTKSASGAERSFVGILVFSTASIENTIFWYRIGFIIATFISLIIGFFITRYLSAYISKPIEHMTTDIGIIASFDRNHPIRETGIQETENLRISINHMNASIITYTSEIERQNNEIRRELNLRKNAENSLSRVNTRLLQLSQITRHDILNQVTALHLYIDLMFNLKEKSEYDSSLRKAASILDIITNLLYFTYDYEKIGMSGPVWQDLSEILKECMKEFEKQITITYSCDSIEILVDPLFKKVIYNLIDNTIRHGEYADTVEILFTERDNLGILTYKDNGSGVDENNKKKIFHHAFGKGSGFGLAFIKEVLESDGIQIREVGMKGKGVVFEMIIPKDRYRCQYNVQTYTI